MGTLFDSQEFKEKAKRIFMSSKKMLDEHSVALCQMCVAYLDYLNPPTEVNLGFYPYHGYLSIPHVSGGLPLMVYSGHPN